MIGLGLALGLRSGGAAAPAGKTYADFLAAMTALYPTTTTWSATGVQGTRRVTAAAAAGNMYGTSDQGVYVNGETNVSRLVQHGLPSQAVFNEIVAAGRQVVFSSNPLGIDIGAGETVFGQNRNGYNSMNRDGPQGDLNICENIIWWDEAVKKAYYRNPRNGTAPMEYPL